MFVGICKIDVYMPTVHSLKEKRHILKCVIERVKNRFNISIAEVDNNDLWQRGSLGIALIGNDCRFVNSSMDKILNFLESNNLFEIIGRKSEVMSLKYVEDEQYTYGASGKFD